MESNGKLDAEPGCLTQTPDPWCRFGRVSCRGSTLEVTDVSVQVSNTGEASGRTRVCGVGYRCRACAEEPRAESHRYSEGAREASEGPRRASTLREQIRPQRLAAVHTPAPDHRDRAHLAAAL